MAQVTQKRIHTDLQPPHTIQQMVCRRRHFDISTVTDLNTELEAVKTFSEWSGTRLNFPKCTPTGYFHALQLIKRKTDRDTALQARLAHVRVGTISIHIISKDDPLPDGYLGTALTTSLCPKAHLAWTLDTLANISKAILSTPYPPDIKQRLLLYGANSKIMHTHCLTALTNRHNLHRL
jgi:hypothetical protein